MPPQRRAFTLLEIMLVIGIIGVVTALVMPNFFNQIEDSRLYTSADRMRSLLAMARSNAMFDGMRYRIRFPLEDELDDQGDDRQPVIEREDNPIDEPDVFFPIREPWVYGETLLKGCWCAQVRLGKPTAQQLLDGLEAKEMQEEREQDFQQFEDEDPYYPYLYINPDGTCEWATFVITNVSRDLTIDDMEEGDPAIEVIVDGDTGLIWLQRPFFQEELEMLVENHWPPVLRKDFLRPQLLTEADVLEIRERKLRK